MREDTLRDVQRLKWAVEDMASSLPLATDPNRPGDGREHSADTCSMAHERAAIGIGDPDVSKLIVVLLGKGCLVHLIEDDALKLAGRSH